MLLTLLEQAAVAAQQRNWNLVNQYLQDLPVSEELERLRGNERVILKSANDLLFKTDAESFNNNQSIEHDLKSSSVSPYLAEILNLALQVLEGGDFNQRWEIAKVFPKLGEIAIAPLIEIVQDEESDWEWRWFVARILGEFNHPAVVKALVELLRTAEDEELAAIAAAGLAKLGGSAITALRELLADAETRLLAVRSLSQIRSFETITPLIEVAKDSDISVRVAAIEALSSFHDPRVPPVLINALQDLAAPVRKEAVIGLGMRSDLLPELDIVRELQPLLYDFNLDVCHQVAIALGRLGTPAATVALFEVLKSPNTPVSLQIDVIRALSWINDQKALEFLQQVLFARVAESPLQSNYLNISKEIITVLGRIEKIHLKPFAAKILADFLDSKHPATQDLSIKQSIATGLGQLSDVSVINSLIELLADDDLGVRLHTIAALKKFPMIKEQLEELLTKKNIATELKQAIAIALGEF